MKQNQVLHIEIERSKYMNGYNYQEGDIKGHIHMSNWSLEQILDEIKDKMKELGK